MSDRKPVTNLIGAAPYLLAALEALVDASTGKPTEAYRQFAIREAQAAIARARGETK